MRKILSMLILAGVIVLAGIGVGRVKDALQNDRDVIEEVLHGTPIPPTPTPVPPTPTPVPAPTWETIEIEGIAEEIYALEAEYPGLDIVMIAHRRTKTIKTSTSQYVGVAMRSLGGDYWESDEQWFEATHKVVNLAISHAYSDESFIAIKLLGFRTNDEHTAENLRISMQLVCPTSYGQFESFEEIMKNCELFPAPNAPLYDGELTYYGREDVPSIRNEGG